jgi:17beta-estradiol 17-dehydrogenase / very-long-chain 3-oxoacyl-CoA reductase
MLQTVALFVGAIVLVKLAWDFLQVLWQIVRPAKDLKKLGSWAVVTGPTSGIGNAMALELARRGMNVLLIGRTQSKLDTVAKEVGNVNKSVKADTLCIDLSKMSDDDLLAYRESIADKDVGVLVNNAGLSYPYTMYFDEVDDQRIEDMMAVNVRAVTMLTKATIGKFLAKKKGAVINIASAGAVVPHSLHAVYSGSKTYILKMTTDLGREYKSKGISFQTQIPFFVVSNMSKIKRASLTVPSGDSYARAAVSQIGYTGVVSPYWVHAFIFYFIKLIPEFILNQQIHKMHLNVRRRGHKKHGFESKKQD